MSQTDEVIIEASEIHKSFGATKVLNGISLSVTKGEVVVLINPLWAERFAKTFPKMESLQECLYESAFQPIDFWPVPNQAYLRDSDRVDSRGRVHAVTGPDRIQPVVCGGLGNLHATILPSWGESVMQSKVTLRAA